MIKLKSLQELLIETVQESNLQTALLMNIDGTVISHGSSNVVFTKTVASIVSNVLFF